MKSRLVLLICMFALGETKEYCAEKRICESHTMCLYPARVACDTIMNSVNVGRDLEIFITHIHNAGREVIAFGRDSPAIKHTGPRIPSSNMRRVIWDDELAMYAQRYANSCYISQTDYCRDILEKGKRKPVGQLVARYFVPEKLSKVSSDLEIKFVVMAITAWYFTGRFVTKEIIHSYQPYLNHSTPFKAIINPMDYRAYTQLLWARTNKLGCGFISYHGNRGIHYVLVCNYYPAGNIPGKRVFLNGTPCSACWRGCNRRYFGLCSATVNPYPSSVCITIIFLVYNVT